MGGDPEFHFDLLKVASYTLDGVTISNGRAGGMTPVAPGADVLGRDQTVNIKC